MFKKCFYLTIMLIAIGATRAATTSIMTGPTTQKLHILKFLKFRILN
jgi:hypothetical protein